MALVTLWTWTISINKIKVWNPLSRRVWCIRSKEPTTTDDCIERPSSPAGKNKNTSSWWTEREILRSIVRIRSWRQQSIKKGLTRVRRVIELNHRSGETDSGNPPIVLTGPSGKTPTASQEKDGAWTSTTDKSRAQKDYDQDCPTKTAQLQQRTGKTLFIFDRGFQYKKV